MKALDREDNTEIEASLREIGQILARGYRRLRFGGESAQKALAESTKVERPCGLVNRRRKEAA